MHANTACWMSYYKWSLCKLILPTQYTGDPMHTGPAYSPLSHRWSHSHCTVIQPTQYHNTGNPCTLMPTQYHHKGDPMHADPAYSILYHIAGNPMHIDPSFWITSHRWSLVHGYCLINPISQVIPVTLTLPTPCHIIGDTLVLTYPAYSAPYRRWSDDPMHKETAHSTPLQHYFGKVDMMSFEKYHEHDDPTYQKWAGESPRNHKIF